MEIDLKKLNEDELIQICIDKGITYQNLKTKKPYAKTTLISYIKKFNKEEEIKEEIKEEEIKEVIEYKNEIIWKLTDEDKKRNDEYNEIEQKLISCIKSCHDILYSNGSITGLKASNDIIKIIICRLFNVIYKKDEIKQIILSKISKEDIDENEKYLIDIREFCKVSNNEGNIDNFIKLFIHDIIIPIFPNIFNGDDILFNTRDYPVNLSKIINKICDLINIDTDDYHLFINLFAETGGNMYEYFTNSYGKGSTSKELGQFFTPFKLINLILYNIKDLIEIDNDYTLYDPCCGSGGLLNRTASFLKINRNNIYGCEIESDTTKYALASLLVNNNSLKINILNKCSLTNNNYLFENKKFDLILTNPPFGTKMIYKELEIRFNDYKNNNYKELEIKFQDIYPINTNNGACLFIQHVIYMLKDNGICGIVLPDGNELTSNGYYNIRKYLINNCKIIKVINVSGGTFGSTGVKTKVIIFKKQKGIENDKNIDFLEINKNCDELKLIATTNLDNNYSFRLKVNQDFILKKDDYELIEFCQMFDLIKGSIQSSKVVEDPNGNGVFISKAEITEDTRKIKYEYYNTNALYIAQAFNGNGKCPIRYYKNNSIHSNLLYHIKIKNNYNDKINIKYIYYYLLEKQNYIEENYQLGCANKSLDVEEFNLMKIPIPSIGIQNKKVDDIDKLEASIETIKLRTEQIKHEQNYILNSILSTDINNIQYKTLGEIFILNGNGSTNSKDITNSGEYPFYRASCNNPSGTHCNYDFDGKEYLLIIKSGGCANKPISADYGIGKVFIVNGKCAANIAVFQLLLKNNEIYNIKYLYYYLIYIQSKIQELALYCTNNGNIDMKELMNLKIPIPTIEKQKEIIDILDGINNRINEDIKYIEVLRKLISKSI
uniref:site-specific DNA-methyltransferase (adenine-specific) n=1 Tax=viral metagenome TaxID=1070528 RepID=A0A6C0ENE4_9ZZZZ